MGFQSFEARPGWQVFKIFKTIWRFLSLFQILTTFTVENVFLASFLFLQFGTAAPYPFNACLWEESGSVLFYTFLWVGLSHSTTACTFILPSSFLTLMQKSQRTHAQILHIVFTLHSHRESFSSRWFFMFIPYLNDYLALSHFSSNMQNQ